MHHSSSHTRPSRDRQTHHRLLEMASMIVRRVARSLSTASVASRCSVVAPCTQHQLCAAWSVRSTLRTPLTRAFSSDNEAAAAPPAVDSLDENRFLELAEGALNDIQTWVDGIEEMLEESDVSLAQGVLKIDLGEHGVWVLNRQIPNRQIWWSSPISGPRRYEFDATTGKWLNTRDKAEMFEQLQDEIEEATGISIFN